jgi:hypothetical protein
MLSRSLARSAFRDPETALQVRDRPAPPLRAQKFPRDTSLSMSMSSACSATIRFKRAQRGRHSLQDGPLELLSQ